MGLWHDGPIEEYQVHDFDSGKTYPFRDFDEADSFLQKLRTDHPDHAITLLALID
jgi:hypothetical protein